MPSDWSAGGSAWIRFVGYRRRWQSCYLDRLQGVLGRLRDRLMMTKLSDDKAWIRMLSEYNQNRAGWHKEEKTVSNSGPNSGNGQEEHNCVWTVLLQARYECSGNIPNEDEQMSQSLILYIALCPHHLPHLGALWGCFAVSLILIPAASVMVALIFQQARTRRIYSDVSEKNSRRYT